VPSRFLASSLPLSPGEDGLLRGTGSAFERPSERPVEGSYGDAGFRRSSDWLLTHRDDRTDTDGTSRSSPGAAPSRRATNSRYPGTT
jgi:hypothetical protein